MKKYEKMILNKDAHKESLLFLQEVEKIENVKSKLLDKKAMANDKIAELRSELAEIDRQNLFETDQDKIRELAQKKKDIRYEIEEYESILQTMYNPIIKGMVKDIEPFEVKANTERSDFDSAIAEEIKQLKDERETYEMEFLNKLNKLETKFYDHPQYDASRRYEWLKYDKGEW